MHVSHVIINFYIQQHLFIRLSQFKNIFHQVGSYFHLVKKKEYVDSNITYKLLCLHTRWMWSRHQRNILFLLIYWDLENSIEYFLCIQKFQYSPTTVTYCSTLLSELPINYFCVIIKYYQTGKTGEFQVIIFNISRLRFLGENLELSSLCTKIPAILYHTYFQIENLKLQLSPKYLVGYPNKLYINIQ